MFLSSTSSSTRSATERRTVRVAALAVAAALLAPVAVLFAQVWSTTGHTLAFVGDERRGVAYLGPLTRLLSEATEAQSDTIVHTPVDSAGVRSAIAAVDEVDGRLGGRLRTTERWATIRGIVEDRTSRSWPRAVEAYAQYSDLVIQLVELNRKVGDASRLILDPELDSYYVMNAALVGIPEILVDSGRYTDLSVLSAGSGQVDLDSVAQLTAARNRVATNATDLTDGLLKAFGNTTSTTLGPGLTRPLDDFRTAVDAVAPSGSLLAPTPRRSQSDLQSHQERLQQTALALQDAALRELDRLLADRAADARRSRLVAAGAALVAVLLAGAAGARLGTSWVAGEAPDATGGGRRGRRRAGRRSGSGEPGPRRPAPGRHAPDSRPGRPGPDQPLPRRPVPATAGAPGPAGAPDAAGAAGVPGGSGAAAAWGEPGALGVPGAPGPDQPVPDGSAPGLVGAGGAEPWGGARAAR